MFGPHELLCIHMYMYYLMKNINAYDMLHSVTVTAKSSKKNERRQVNEKFNKLERIYRDCIKRTRDKTRMIQYTARCTRRLILCDQTRKCDISESIIQALIMTLLPTMS